MAKDDYIKTANLRAKIDLDDINPGFRTIVGKGLCAQLRLDLDADGRIDTRVATVPVSEIVGVTTAELGPLLRKCVVACVADLGLTKE